MPARSAQLRPAPSVARPKRQSAGKRATPQGFVNTKDPAVDRDIGSGSDYEPEGDDSKKKAWKQKVLPRARPLSPESNILSLPSLKIDAEVGPMESELAGQQLPETLSLTFNVPKGHVGPFVVNLNLGDLGSPRGSSLDSNPSSSTPSTISFPSDVRSHSADEDKAGFNDLPPEIRNIIYHEVIGSGKELSFASPNFCLSSQFLRTCKQVYVEAAPLLYGNHTFRLNRDSNTAGHYWQKPWHEVGYRHIRRWLTDIGPNNIAHLRDLELTLEDGTPRRAWLLSPSSPDYHKSEHARKEEARYVHDADLIECIKLLARFGQLRELKLLYEGRKNLTYRDDRFIAELRKVKVDALKSVGDERVGRYNYFAYSRRPLRVEIDVLEDLRGRMQRKVKLHKPKEQPKKAKVNESANSSPASSSY